VTDLHRIAEVLSTDNEAFLQDGRVIRFTDEQDNDTSINDFECWGRIEYVASLYDRDGNRAERPKGFDGMATKILTDRGDTYWWQPTPDLWGIGADRWHKDATLRQRERSQVRDILNYGFRLLTVEVYSVCGCGSEKLVAYASAGGIEPLGDTTHTVSVIEDLLPEVLTPELRPATLSLTY
jgi:hypothetical protein